MIKYTIRRINPYLAAALAVALAVLARWMLNTVLEDRLPYFTFFIAILTASWYGGLCPGLLAALLSLLSAWYVFVPPYFSSNIPEGSHLADLVVFSLTSFVVACFGAAIASAERRSRRDRQTAEEAHRRADELGSVLRKRVEELDALLRILPVGVLVAHDTSCSNITLNPSAAQMLGIRDDANASKTGAEAAKLPFRVLKDGKEIPGDQLPMQCAARTGESKSGDILEIQHTDGTTRFLYVYALPLFTEQGKLRGSLGVFVDITEVKQAEQALQRREQELRESAHLFKSLSSNAPVGIFQTDAQGHCIFVNGRWSEMTGLAMEAAVGPGWAKALHPEDRDRIQREWYKATCEGREYKDEYRFLSPEGKVVWVSGSAISLRDANGNITGYIGTNTDITALKTAQKDLQQAKDTVSTLLRITTRLNSTLDLDALLDILIQEAINLVGAESGASGLKTPNGMVCKKYFGITGALPFQYCWPPMHGLPGWILVNKVPYLTNNAPEDKQIVHELCLQFRLRSALSTPIITARGEVVGFFEVHNKKDGGFTAADQEMLLAVSQAAAIAIQNALAYRSLQQAQESLQEVDRRKDEFLATLAHELRNPLAPLRNGLQLLKLAGCDPHTAAKAHEIMERQLSQMVRLIDDLLDVSRISRGKLQLQKSRIVLKDVVDSAVETCSSAIEAANHHLEVIIPDEPVYLDADPVRLSQALGNLLSNACKYTGTRGRIELSAYVSGREVIISVQDNGVGIPPAMLTRVFDMFTQVDRSLERTHGGLGIGLSIVKRIVETHGGRVEARSEGAGKGSEFLIHLPIALPRPIEGSSNVQEKLESVAPHLRILVADDNLDSADSLAMRLRLMGHEVRVAYDGQQAIDLAAAYHPDLLLLDIGMPKLNGYDAARLLRKQPWGRLVVLAALTGWGQETDRIKSRDAGFDFHLVKPVEPAALEKLLATLPEKIRK
ncbi:MAG: PAS domain S-box protein [Deltaproteobacteria bacterium]|nr:PAS domain S-box protein [Deltaproteobacteria bacterium]